LPAVAWAGLWLLVLLVPTASGAVEPEAAAGAGDAVSYERAGAEEIRAAVADVLAGPEFSQRRPFWERWLHGFLQWLLAEEPGNSGLAAFLRWVLTVFCVLTLIAILAHMAWTLYVLVRANLPGRGASVRPGLFARAEAESVEDLARRMRMLAEDGAYAEALACMLLLLVRRLDEAALVRFHPSKTNGDYTREYVPGRAGRDGFRRFVHEFDSYAYGGAPCRRPDYEHMLSLSEGVLSDACPGA
jgi:hypothetical protein